MLSFITNAVACISSFIGFVCWQIGVYNYIPDKRIAKLIWQLPCHILCTSYGLLHANLNANESMMIAKPDATHFNICYAFYYGYWLSVVYDFIKNRALKDQDFKIMICHHVATFIALISSDWLGFRDVGLHVLLLHDASDIFIMLLKLVVKYKLSETYVIFMYSICLFTWIYFRLWKFVWKLCSHLIWQKLIMEPFWDGKAIPCIALFTLCGCNLLWTKMLLQLMLKRKLASYEIQSYEIQTSEVETYEIQTYEKQIYEVET